MALPPTALGNLFYHSRDARTAYDLLRSHGALSWKGWWHEAEAIALLHGVIEGDTLWEQAYGPRPPGPSTPGRMADAITNSPYLSKRGHRMSKEPPNR